MYVDIKQTNQVIEFILIGQWNHVFFTFVDICSENQRQQPTAL